MTAPDLDAIEASGKRWHGEDHRIVQVRWEPYKPDGQRQMKAKGRWQEQVGSGDFWRWQNCDRPVGLFRAPLADALAVPTWQPIATVPKDGTRVDLWSRNGRRICNCDPTAYDLRLITHWTPLPEPPAAPTGHWKDACREGNGPEICDEPCSKCLRAIGARANG